MLPPFLTPVPVSRAHLRVWFVALIAFAPSFINQFALDDLVHISQNEQITSLGNGFAAFTQPTAPGNLYRPFVTLTFALLHAVAGLEPMLYHLVNITLHALLSVLLLGLLRRLVHGDIAYITCLLFALHPIHSEVVANITGAFELWCAVWVLVCLQQFLNLFGASPLPARELKCRLALIGGSFLLALLSKESAFVAPLLMLLLAIYAREKLPNRHTLLLLTGTLSAVGLFYCALRTFALGAMLPAHMTIDFLDNPLVYLSPDLRAFNAIALLGRYAALSLVPWELSADYSFAHLAPALENTIESFLGQFACAFVAALALLMIAGRNAYNLFACWFFAAFAVTANFFFPIGTIFAERLVYLPSVGIVGCLGAALAQLPSRFHQRSVTAVLAVTFLGINYLQCAVWYSNESLHAYQATISEKSARTLVNHAVVLRNQGDYPRAELQLDRALDIYPAYAQASFVRATVAFAAGRVGEVESALDDALGVDPEHLPSLSLKARLAFNRGDLKTAEELFSRANRADPKDADVLVGLLAVCVKTGRWAEARKLREVLVRRGVRSANFQSLMAIMDAAAASGAAARQPGHLTK